MNEEDLDANILLFLLELELRRGRPDQSEWALKEFKKIIVEVSI